MVPRGLGREALEGIAKHLFVLDADQRLLHQAGDHGPGEALRSMEVPKFPGAPGRLQELVALFLSWGPPEQLLSRRKVGYPDPKPDDLPCLHRRSGGWDGSMLDQSPRAEAPYVGPG